MLSLGTTVPELEQKPFENGLGAARAALRRECAQRSRDTCLVAERRSPACGSGRIAWKLRRRALRYPLPGLHDRLRPLDPARSTKLKLDNPLVLPVHTARAHCNGESDCEHQSWQ